MKSVKMYFAPAANETATGAATIPKPLTSEKLQALKAEYSEKWQAMLKMSDPFSEETKNAKLAVWKIEGEIKAEEAALVKAQKDAEIEQARNERLKLNENQLASYAHLLAVQSNKKASPEELQLANDAFNTAKELVDNELLARYAGSKSAKKSSGSNENSGSKSEQSAAIIEMFLAGNSNKEIEEAGYKRSTVWHTINNYKKANNM